MHDLHELRCQWWSWLILPPRTPAEHAAVARLAALWVDATDGLTVPPPTVRQEAHRTL